MPIADRAAPSGRTVAILFTVTIFLSASLLFFVQPLFAKLVLPKIGGAPAVWTTSMLFFQTVLIGGYLYAHVLTRHVPVRWQLPVHVALWAAACLFLPLAVPADWQYDAEGSTVLQTLWIFAVGVGLPFGFLSANAPLIQAWYRRSGGPSAHDPYFLYGASNLGSMIALLAFPLVAEPLFGARSIGMGWAVGFVALGGLLFLSGMSARRGALPEAQAEAAPQAPAAGLSAETVALWLLLAFVPSSMMLAVTTKIATDMGAIPLVWVIPLAIYLISFVATFTNRPWVPDHWARILNLVAVGFSVYVFAAQSYGHIGMSFLAGLVLSFAFIAINAHRLLYKYRPDAAHLTVFYVIMSVGGALGGLFNSIVAPAVFSSPWEGGATAVLAALIPFMLKTKSKAPRVLLLVGLPVSLGALAYGAAVWDAGMLTLGAGLGLLVSLAFAPRAVALVVSVCAVTLIGAVKKNPAALFQDRSFFGAHMVVDDDDEDIRRYLNGTTQHGGQRTSELTAERPTPLSYYYEYGPMAQVLTSSLGKNARSVGIVGLGVGALACFKQPGQDWHFYEIDAMVDHLARNPALFTYMTRCAGDAPTHLGDARLVLEGQGDLAFDVLVIDAYSSDSVPVHLTTTEAMALYMQRLAPGGVLVYHISNRYYDIKRPLARSAEALGLNIWFQAHEADPTYQGASHSQAIMIARPGTNLAEMEGDKRWRPIHSDGGRLWTDDYANPLSILYALQ
ncbi:MAG: fused MFS/spermidine synthase [Roseivivax sp.]|nr:fused MFS/spermidine synthase [Roseivivax sp.]